MYKKIVVMLLMIILVACSSTKRKLTDVEKREVSTKIFDSRYDKTYRIVLNLLQDYNFVIEDTDMETGLIIATSKSDTTDRSNSLKKFWVAVSGREKSKLLKANIVVTKISDDKTRVKLNLREINRIDSNFRKARTETSDVEDPLVYINMFKILKDSIEKVENIVPETAEKKEYEGPMAGL